MLDLPAAAPARERCDTCGFPADLAQLSPDGELAVACWRDRGTLPSAGPGTRQLERRFGRWCSGRVSVEELLGSTLDLECENCRRPGSVVYSVTTAEGRWETVACLACIPARPVSAGRRGRPAPGSPIVVQRAHAQRVGRAWRPVAARWWPRPS